MCTYTTKRIDLTDLHRLISGVRPSFVYSFHKIASKCIKIKMKKKRNHVRESLFFEANWTVFCRVLFLCGGDCCYCCCRIIMISLCFGSYAAFIYDETGSIKFLANVTRCVSIESLNGIEILFPEV